MAFEMSTEIIVIIASILGSAAATLYPYWEKLRETPELVFEKKFIGTAAISVITAVALGISIFPQMLETVVGSTLSLAGIFAIVATTAFGINRGSNMLMTRPFQVVASTAAEKEKAT